MKCCVRNIGATGPFGTPKPRYDGVHCNAHAGEWLAVAANTNAHTYEVAPVFTLAETEVLAKFGRVVGGAFAEAHDGLFVPGGSIANLYGVPAHVAYSGPSQCSGTASGSGNMLISRRLFSYPLQYLQSIIANT